MSANQELKQLDCDFIWLLSRWPRTLAGIKAYLPCNRLPTSAGTYSGSTGEEQRAWRFCDRKGLWAEEDYSRCQFQKDVTRFLYVINQVCVCRRSLCLFILFPFCTKNFRYISTRSYPLLYFDQRHLCPQLHI